MKYAATWLCLLLIFTSRTNAQALADTSFGAYVQTIGTMPVRFTMVPLPAGNFEMGSNQGKANEKPATNVQLDAFWMDANETTYESFQAFMQDDSISQNSKTDAVTRPSQPYIDMTLGMGKTGGFPANSMQQYGALMYCRWLYLKTGIFYRLPTEAEWEYAARAGSNTVYPFGNDSKQLGNYAWFAGNSEGKYHKVGEKKPNAWGLYDMLGNVAEWTMDQYDSAYFTHASGPMANPLAAPTSRNPRTVRGGNYSDDATALRPAARLKSDPIWNRRDPQIPRSRWWNADAPFVGFRVIRPRHQPTAEEVQLFFKTWLSQ